MATDLSRYARGECAPTRRPAHCLEFGRIAEVLEWPATWTDRAGRDRTPSVPGHELSGVVAELGYATTGLSVGQRMFGLADRTRNGALADLGGLRVNLGGSPGQRRVSVENGQRCHHAGGAGLLKGGPSRRPTTRPTCSGSTTNNIAPTA
jgi:hypothetical protein